MVVGKPLKGLKVDKVAGASWTSDAFNKALEVARQERQSNSPFLLKPTRHARLASVRTVSCGYRADSAHTFGQSNVAMFSAQESDLRSFAGLPFPSGFLVPANALQASMEPSTVLNRNV